MAQAPAKGSLLLSSTAVSDDGEKLMVSLPKGSHFAARMLERGDVRASVDPVVAAAFGPRQVVYVESSLASRDISRADRPAAPAAAPAPAAPAPRPEPAPQPAAPAAQPPAYPMPWDAPVPQAPERQEAPAPAPADDQVPYSDADLTVYEETYDPEFVAAPPSTPAMPPSAGPVAQPPVPAAEVTPSASSRSGRGVNRAPSGRGGLGRRPPAGLTPEFADIASMLAEAFGQPVSVSVESAATTSDEDAAGRALEGGRRPLRDGIH